MFTRINTRQQTQGVWAHLESDRLYWHNCVTLVVPRDVREASHERAEVGESSYETRGLGLALGGQWLWLSGRWTLQLPG